MKKLFVSLVLILVGVVAIVACSDSNKGRQASVVNLKDKNNVYAVSAVSSIDTLTQQNTPQVLSTNTDLVATGAIDVVKSYTNLVEGLLKGETGMTVTNNEVGSDSEFATHLTITVTNLDGTSSNYDFFYTETLISEEIEEDDDEIEIEKKSSIVGKIVKDEMTYQVRGVREVETEDDEESFETELKVSLDDKNYSIVKYETETELEDGKTELEKEFKHVVYVDGRKVSETEIDFEYEDNKAEVEIEVVEGRNKGKYTFKQHDNKPNQIYVSYDVELNGSKEKGALIITITVDDAGVKTYTYEERTNRRNTNQI